MQTLCELSHAIEADRAKLSELVKKKRYNLQDKEVVSLSEKLDQLLVLYEKAKQE